MTEGLIWNAPFYLLGGLTIVLMIAWPCGVEPAGFRRRALSSPERSAPVDSTYFSKDLKAPAEALAEKQSRKGGGIHEVVKTQRVETLAQR